MKKTVITLLVVMVVSFAFSAVFFGASGLMTLENKGAVLSKLNSISFIDGIYIDELSEINQYKEVDITNITEIEIITTSAEVILKPVDKEVAGFKLNGYGTDQNLTITRTNGKLVVSIEHPKTSQYFRGTLYSMIPRDYNKTVTVRTISGDVFATNFELEAYDVTTTSGDIDLMRVNAYSCIFKSTSGEVDVVDSVCDSSLIDTVSGDIEIENGFLGDMETVSGSIEASDIAVIGDVNIETVSGDVDIFLIEDSSVQVDFNSLSGAFKGKTDFGESEYILDISTTSGDVSVEDFYSQ